MINLKTTAPRGRQIRIGIKLAVPVATFAGVMLAPTPGELTGEGQRAFAIMVFAVMLWITDTLPITTTGIISVALLVVFKGVDQPWDALFGFSEPVPYFLIGILTLGLAVQRSGLADRLARFLILSARGSPLMLYSQMLLSFAALTFALPSAATRGAILVHVYERILAYWNVPNDSPLNKAIMLGLGSLNRLGSTALLAGGITPLVASALLDDFSWTRWFVLMSVPFYILLIVGGLLLYFLYRRGFDIPRMTMPKRMTAKPLDALEIKAGLITLGTALLWFTDFAHGLQPAIPALIALAFILTPRLGVLKLDDFFKNVGWTNFFVISTSLSLAHALITSGAAGWLADTLVNVIEGLRGHSLMVLLALAAASAGVRLVVPNITGYLILVIPVAMSTGESLGLNPLVCGMAAVVVGDAVVFFPAQSPSSVFIFNRANLSGYEVFRVGSLMTLAAIAILFTIAIPYWNLVGESLTI